MTERDLPPERALSIRAPWWWFILHGGKDIENRNWPTKFRGRVAIHASSWFNGSQIVSDWKDMTIHPLKDTALRLMRDYGGHIIGTVEIVDCVTESDSPWFFGKYGFVLRNPVILHPPIKCQGALGFFKWQGNVQG